jgi:hypothetical protein
MVSRRGQRVLREVLVVLHLMMVVREHLVLVDGHVVRA